MNKFYELIQGTSGKLSAMRFIMLIWLIGILLTWGYCSYINNSIQNIPEGVITLAGILVGGKTIQRFGEKKTTETTEEIK